MAKYTTEDFKKQVRELYPNIEILSNTFSLILLILILAANLSNPYKTKDNTLIKII